VLHAVSTRISPGGTDWNLSARRGTPQHPPDPDVAQANRRALADRLGISLENMVGCQQVHGNRVAIVTRGDAGRGMFPHLPAIQGADALVTDVPGLYLLALSADCPPVFFYDPVRRVVGLAHSGWKGTVGRIVGNVVEAMVDNLGSEPKDIKAAVGPGIGPCCYSVGENVIEAARQAFPSTRGSFVQEREGTSYFDLHGAIVRTLLDSGLLPERIAVEAVCTGHNTHLFYSHRMEAGRCGLFGAVLGLRPA
jgi:YfiH family protein